MAIIIKEIEVKTIVEKKMLYHTDISQKLYKQLKEEIVSELATASKSEPRRKRNER